MVDVGVVLWSQVSQVLLGTLDRQAATEVRVRKVLRAALESREIQDLLDSRDRLDHRVREGHKASEVQMDHWGNLETLVLRVLQAIWDPPARLDSLELPAPAVMSE